MMREERLDLRAGIIGAGAISVHHITAATSAGFEVRSICDANRARLDEACRQYGTSGFTDYEELLDSGVDIAVIALPHALHYEAAMSALEHGCHVVLEKPVVTKLEDGLGIMRKAKERNLRVMTADTAYHLPKVACARGIAASGRLGRFISAAFINYKDHYFSPNRPAWFLDPALAGGGVLINVGVHRIATLRGVLGKDEKSVKAAVGFFEKGYDIEGNGSLFLSYEDGTAALLEETAYFAMNPQLSRCCHFNFENGVIDLSEGLRITYKDGRSETVETGETSNNYIALYEELKAAVNEDREPFPGIKEGLKDVRVILAAYQSATDGCEVMLDSEQWQIS